MTSLFLQINRSSHSDLWRRFRMPADRLRQVMMLARALNCDVREGQGVRVLDGNAVRFVAEPSASAPAPFREQVPACLAAFTDSPAAIREFDQWQGIRRPANREQEGTAPLMVLLEQEERSAWLELERRILQSLQELNNLDLEGEALFFSLGQILRDVFAPDLVDLHMESPADYWPGRADDWSWIQAGDGLPPTATLLTPRLQRLLYRRRYQS